MRSHFVNRAKDGFVAQLGRMLGAISSVNAHRKSKPIPPPPARDALAQPLPPKYSADQGRMVKGMWDDSITPCGFKDHECPEEKSTLPIQAYDGGDKQAPADAAPACSGRFCD